MTQSGKCQVRRGKERGKNNHRRRSNPARGHGFPAYGPLEQRALLASGPALLRDIEPGAGWSQPREFTDVNALVYFSAETPTTGRELWCTDGTAADTRLVKDIQPGAGGSDPIHLINVAGTLFFSATDGTNGHELWRSDGTTAGSFMVLDVNPGTGDGFRSLPAIGMGGRIGNRSVGEQRSVWRTGETLLSGAGG